MRIAINACSLRSFGSRLVGQGLLSALPRAGDGHDFVAWVPSDWGWPRGRTDARLEVRVVPGGAMGRARDEILRLPWEIRDFRADVLLSLVNSAVPRLGVPQVVLVQQAYLAYPEQEWGFSAPPMELAGHRLRALWFRWTMRDRCLWVTQTESMKRALTRRWGLDPAAISVIPSEVTVPVGGARLPPAEPLVVYAAHHAPNKNHLVLPRMVAELKRRGSQVRLAVSVSPRQVPSLVQQALDLRVLESFQFLGDLAHPAALELIGRAACVVMPSKLESFGLPYYEAMALGTPVIAADRDFAREAVGDAGLFADPDSAEEFAAHVDQVLRDQRTWLRLSSAGQSRYAGLRRSGADIAAAYLQLLERAMAA